MKYKNILSFSFQISWVGKEKKAVENKMAFQNLTRKQKQETLPESAWRESREQRAESRDNTKSDCFMFSCANIYMLDLTRHAKAKIFCGTRNTQFLTFQIHHCLSSHLNLSHSYRL
jgi:hypothetical protein